MRWVASDPTTMATVELAMPATMGSMASLPHSFHKTAATDPAIMEHTAPTALAFFHHTAHT